MAESFSESMHTGHPPVWPHYIDDRREADSDTESVAKCPVCAEPIDCCQGHGTIGDPVGASILSAHDEGYHGRCHPDGCDDRADMLASVPESMRTLFSRGEEAL